jgi:hypothetical protein
MNLLEVIWDIDWIDMFQNRYKSRAVVNLLMKLPVK